MPRRCALAGLIAVLVLVAAPGAPGAPAPVRFDGTSAGGAPVVLHLTARRAAYDLRVIGRCSDGSRFASGLTGGGAEIDADGRFFADVKGVHRRYRGRPGTYAFALRAQRQGNAIRGSVRVSFRARGLSCDSGATSFTAYRDGSPGAPLRDARAATGGYAARGKGLGDVAVRVFLPARRVRSVSFSWRVRCRRRGVLIGHEDFRDLALTRGRFGVSGHGTTGLGGGRTSREYFALSGRLFRSGGVYQISGTWRLRSAIVRGGKVISRCATPGLSFAGRLRGR